MHLFFAVVEEHTHPVVWWPLACQIIVLVLGMGLAAWYYGKVVQNADRTFVIQQSDAYLRHKTEFGQVGEKLSKFCAEVFTGALDGTRNPQGVKKANENLGQVLLDIPSIRAATMGVGKDGPLNGLFDRLEASVRAYVAADNDKDPHFKRTQIVGDLETCTTELKENWNLGANAKLNQLEGK